MIVVGVTPPPPERVTTAITVGLSTAEKAYIAAEAKKAGLSMSSWARRRIFNR